MTEVLEDLTVRDIARVVIARYQENEIPLPTNAELAAEVYEAIDPDKYAEALREVLPKAVSYFVTDTHRNFSDLVAADDNAKEKISTQPKFERIETFTEDGEHVEEKSKVVHHQVSGWVARSQDANFRSRVLGQLYVGADGVRKALSMFNLADLTALANDLASRRDSLEAQRVKFMALADALESEGASTVSDLSTETLKTVLA